MAFEFDITTSASGFDVATSAGLGDGNEHPKPPPVKSIAGEVVKRKRQFNNAVPPPALPASFASNSSRPRTQQEGQAHWDNSEQYQRSANNFINPDTTFLSLAPSVETAETSITVSIAALTAIIEKLLESNPELGAYVQYKEPLERRGNGYPEFPIPEILFSNSCQTCLDHGDVCVVEQGSSSSRCTACAQLGGRCLFINVENPGFPRTSDVHMNCGRCERRWIVSNPRNPIREIKLPFSPSEKLRKDHVVPQPPSYVPTSAKEQSEAIAFNPLTDQANRPTQPSSPTDLYSLPSGSISKTLYDSHGQMRPSLGE